MYDNENYENELYPSPDRELHLPLDWNEELSLEEYLERLKQNSDKILNH